MAIPIARIMPANDDALLSVQCPNAGCCCSRLYSISDVADGGMPTCPECDTRMHTTGIVVYGGKGGEALAAVTI